MGTDRPRLLVGLPVGALETLGPLVIPPGASHALHTAPIVPMRISRIRWRAMSPGLILQDLRVGHWSQAGGATAGIHLELSGLWRFPGVDVFAGAQLSAWVSNYSPQPVQLIEFVWWGRPLQNR